MIQTRWTLWSLAVTTLMTVSPSSAMAFADLFTAGHGDVSIVYNADEGILEFEYELASNAVINGVPLGAKGTAEPTDLITVVPQSSQIDGGLTGLPGNWSSQTFWYLPQSSTAGVPFLGIGAEEIDLGIFTGNQLTFSLQNVVSAPAGGEFILFQLGLPNKIFMNTEDGISGADSLTVSATGHDHYVWGFSKVGTYVINFGASGTLDGPESLVTGSGQFTFTVVPEPSTYALAGVATVVMGIMSRRRKSLHRNHS